VTTTLADLDWPFRTERLSLRRARVADAEAIWPWYGRPEVHEWTYGLPASLTAHVETWEQSLAARIVGELNGRVVAVGGVMVQDAWSQRQALAAAHRRQGELSWVLDPEVQGQGLGTEYAAALLRIAIAGLGLHRVEASCFAANAPSARIMEKIGLRCEGVFRGDSLHADHGWMDGMTWAILDEEWHAQHPEPRRGPQDPPAGQSPSAD
jgi:RimJ/RimL family protein N-acetyltransferase